MTDFAGTIGNDLQDGTAGADTFDYSQGGDDTLNGKGDDDVFSFGAAFNANDSIDGGGGFDDLVLEGDTNVHLTSATLISVERIEMFGLHSYSLTTDEATVGTGKLLELFCGGAFSFDGSAETDGTFFVRTTDQADTVIGGAGSDDINTDRGVDAIYGGDGDDILDGGSDSSADTINGGDGNDVIRCEDGDLAFGGDGNDAVTFRGGSVGVLDGGSGTDTLDLSSGAGFDGNEFSASATGFEVLLIGTWGLDGDGNANIIDLSGFTGPTAGQKLTINGGGGADTLIGNVERDIIHGGGGANTLSGMDGNDKLSGGSKADTLDGGAGVDRLTGKGGADTYVYGGASDSTGPAFDTVIGFDADDDKFDAGTVNAIDTAIATGTLSRQTFNADLSAVVDDAHLAANDAVLFTPDAGGMEGRTFLIVDLNGTAGYQAGEDLVVTLKNAVHLDDLSAGNFI